MITNLDIAIIVSYIILMFGISIFFSVGQGLDGFLLNSRKTRLLLLVLTVVSTNIGAGFFMGVAAEAYATGISFGLVILSLTILICIVLAYFAPKIKSLADSGGIYTLPEFLGQSYRSKSVLLVSASIILIGYFFVTALQFVGIAAVSTVITGWDFNRVLVGVGFVTILYTSIGGIRSNVYTDAFSFVLTVSILLIAVPLIVGSGQVSFSQLPSRFFDPFAFGGPAFFFLSIILSTISAFFFMELWQRIFSAESVNTARMAFVISAFVQAPFIVLGIVLGLVGAVLFPDIDKSTVIFRVFVHFLPSGLLGLGLVAILAILMDTVNALVVVGGSTLVNDFYKPLRPHSTEKHLLYMARILTLAFGFVALVTATFLSDIVRLLLIGAFIMMPLAPTILGALILESRNALAALLSMTTGFAVTVVLIPLLPETAFVPGFLVSLAVYLLASWLNGVTIRFKMGW